MCGRYTLIRLADLIGVFPWVKAELTLPARFNIAPGTPIPVLANDRPDSFDLFMWGLIPSWAKDQSIGNKLINARAETLDDKPSFCSCLRNRRCLIPADGFYEWKSGKSGKTPVYFRLKSHRPFAFAGLWDSWHGPGGEEVRSCTLITTTPNPLVAPVHNRMPVILRSEDYRRWLAPGEAEGLTEMLRPYPAEEMESYEVSNRVNRPAMEGPELIEPRQPEPKPTDEGLFSGL